MFQILIADDEPNIREGVRQFITRRCPEWQVVGAARDGKEALAMAERFLPDCIMTDITMPHVNGLEFLEKIKEELPDAKLLILSGYDDFEYAVQGMRLGVSDYLLKPLDTELLFFYEFHLFHLDQSRTMATVRDYKSQLPFVQHLSRCPIA